MSVDQPGHQGSALKVDRPLRRRPRREADLDDPAVLDAHEGTVERRTTRRVDQTDIGEDHRAPGDHWHRVSSLDTAGSILREQARSIGETRVLPVDYTEWWQLSVPLRRAHPTEDRPESRLSSTSSTRSIAAVRQRCPSSRGRRASRRAPYTASARPWTSGDGSPETRAAVRSSSARGSPVWLARRRTPRSQPHFTPSPCDWWRDTTRPHA